MATKAEQIINAAETPSPKTAADLVGEIGTLTYPRAIAAFGEQNAVHVMKEVARIGGHGIFEEAELRHPLFGGLAMPHPDSIAKPNKADFDKLPEPEFYYQAALEDHETLRRKPRSVNGSASFRADWIGQNASSKKHELHRGRRQRKENV